MTTNNRYCLPRIPSYLFGTKCHIYSKTSCQVKSEKTFRSSHRRCSVRKGVLRTFAKFTGKHLCQGLLAQMFSCKFCESSKNTFFTDLQNISVRLLLDVRGSIAKVVLTLEHRLKSSTHLHWHILIVTSTLTREMLT